MIRTYKKDCPARLVIYCKSRPLSRGRISKKHHIYQSLSNQQDQIYWLEQYEPLEIDYPCYIEVTLGFLKSGKSLFPVNPEIGDIDNHVKALLDNLQRAKHIHDDRYVVGVKAHKKWSTANYIDILIWKVTNEKDLL